MDCRESARRRSTGKTGRSTTQLCANVIEDISSPHGPPVNRLGPPEVDTYGQPLTVSRGTSAPDLRKMSDRLQFVQDYCARQVRWAAAETLARRSFCRFYGTLASHGAAL